MIYDDIVEGQRKHDKMETSKARQRRDSRDRPAVVSGKKRSITQEVEDAEDELRELGLMTYYSVVGLRKQLGPVNLNAITRFIYAVACFRSRVQNDEHSSAPQPEPAPYFLDSYARG